MVKGYAVPWPYKFLENQPNFVKDNINTGTDIAPMKIFV